MPDQIHPDRNVFLEQNQQELAELLTFIDFAQGLTIGFIKVNQERDKALLVETLRQQLAETDVRLEVLNFSQERDLRRLREALMQRIERVQTDKKLVLLIQGLEVAIGTDGIGAYPPILQDLNFVRDAYRKSVPHPLLFVLPDYAITRVSKYAPDFWAWKSGFFEFKTSQQRLQQLQTEAFQQPLPQIASSETQDQIDQLNQLLMELRPAGKSIDPQNLRFCSEIYYKMGSAYLTQQQPEKAKDYLREGLKLLTHHPDPVLSQSLHRKLGNAYEKMRQFEHAIVEYNTALEEAQSLDQPQRVATVLADLGDVALEQRQFEQANAFYRQSLSINEAHHNRYSQASTYHQLGMVAQKMREYEQARSYYQQALDIKTEFGDRYSQASTYLQLGKVFEALNNISEARTCYLQDLQITSEFNDEHVLGIILRNLARFYQEHPDDEFLIAVAQCLNATVEAVRQRFENLNRED